MTQTIASLWASLTCRHQTSHFYNLLLYIGSHGIEEPGKILTKADCNICYQKLDILQVVNTLAPVAVQFVSFAVR